MTAVYGLGVCLGTTVGALVRSECRGRFRETLGVENKNGNCFSLRYRALPVHQLVWKVGSKARCISTQREGTSPWRSMDEANSDADINSGGDTATVKSRLSV